MSSERQEVTLMNISTEKADILLSTLTTARICPITEKQIIFLYLSHLRGRRKTAGKSVRQTLGMGVGLCLPFHFLAY